MTQRIEALRETLHEQIEKADERLLRLIHAMTEAWGNDLDFTSESHGDKVLGYRPDGSPVLAKEAKELYLKVLEEMENGDYVTLDELKESAKSW